jgi:hypothetical protein
MKHILLIIYTVVICFSGISQESLSIKKTNQKFVELKYHYGKFARKTNSDVTSIVENPYNAINLRVGIQSSGIKQEWDQIYGYPIYGVGLYKIWFYGNELGSPQAVYIFLKPPIIRTKNFSWNWEISAGISFGFNKYNPYTNSEQKVIGSNVNSYFNLGTGINYSISERWDLSFFVDLTHFSNGAVRTPNIGVNLMGISPSIIYNFNKKNGKKFSRNTFEKKELSKFKRSSNLQILAVGGGKTTTNDIYDGPTYFAGSLSFDYAYKYSRVSKIGIGIDGFYESALRKYPDPGIEDPSFSDLSYLGIHLAHHLMVYKFRMMLQFGTYLTSNVSHKGSTYIIVTLDYYAAKNLFFSYHLKTRNGSVADFFGLGI